MRLIARPRRAVVDYSSEGLMERDGSVRVLPRVDIPKRAGGGGNGGGGNGQGGGNGGDGGNGQGGGPPGGNGKDGPDDKQNGPGSTSDDDASSTSASSTATATPSSSASGLLGLGIGPSISLGLGGNAATSSISAASTISSSSSSSIASTSPSSSSSIPASTSASATKATSVAASVAAAKPTAGSSSIVSASSTTPPVSSSTEAVQKANNTTVAQARASSSVPTTMLTSTTAAYDTLPSGSSSLGSTTGAGVNSGAESSTNGITASTLDSGSSKTPIIIGVSSGVGGLAMFICIVFLIRRIFKKRRVGKADSPPGSPLLAPMSDSSLPPSLARSISQHSKSSSNGRIDWRSNGGNRGLGPNLGHSRLGSELSNFGDGNDVPPLSPLPRAAAAPVTKSALEKELYVPRKEMSQKPVYEMSG